jgi:lysophospholipase L1-like esterase
MGIQSIINLKKNIMFKIKYIWALTVLFVFAACEDGKFDREIAAPIEVVSGEANFTNYVAIGNSLTAGIADGALFKASQANSYPNLLAEKMALAGGGEFTQPWMNDNVGGLLLAGDPIEGPFGPRLYFDGSGLAVLPQTPSTDVTNIIPGPYNNMGVPGAKSFHLLANGYGNLGNLALGLANPYFVRMASSPDASVLEDALAANPTFFSLWIGSNDVLQYAATGGDGSDAITDKAMFDGAMGALIGYLTSTGAKGVVGNIPNVLLSPFFTAVPYAPLDPSNPEFAAQIPLLNDAYEQLNGAFAYLGVPERSVVFSTTAASPIVIHDESLPNITAQLFQVLQGGLDAQTAGLLAAQYGQSRQANENDMLLLTSQLVIGELNTDYFQQLVDKGVPPEFAGQLSVNGLTYPMPDEWVLLPSEQLEVTEATTLFNQTIQQLASNAGLAFFDAHALLEMIAQNGYSSDGFNVTTDLLTGGLFSLDGLHYTARGGAIVANEMMRAIDATYESNFEEAGVLNDIGAYPVIYSPALQ